MSNRMSDLDRSGAAEVRRAIGRPSRVGIGARLALLAFSVFVLEATWRCAALVYIGSNDPEHNTTAPTGTLSGSGWELQGNWGNFVGTPIAPNLFVSARHVGGNVGDTFVLQGKRYQATAKFLDAASDLAVYKIAGHFPGHAQLYRGTNELNKLLVVCGRGALRGTQVNVTNTDDSVTLRGWRWGTGDGRVRWGTNRVHSIVNLGAGLGNTLMFTFDATGGDDETALAGGDSAGAVFVRSNLEWFLAGINYAVSGPYSYTNSGTGMNASLFDARGFFIGGEGNWKAIDSGTSPVPGECYATRIADRLAWLDALIASDGNTWTGPVLESADDPTGPFKTVSSGVLVDLEGREIRIPPPSSRSHYRLRDAVAWRIGQPTLSNGFLVLPFDLP